MTNKRDLEKRLAELRGGVPADGEAPSPGTSVTRYYRTEAGEWVAEDGGES